MKNKLSNQELFHFCEQFAIILRSGISSTEGLAILCDDCQSDYSKKILTSLLEDFENSGSFSDALEKAQLFPASMISYVKAGEETGCLDEVMQSLADQYEQEIEISENIKNAVAYPLLMLGMMAAVIVILLVKVLPVFQQVFRQMGMEMNGLSARLLNTGTAISTYSTVFLVIAAILIILLLFLFIHPKGRQLLTGLSQKLPYFKKIPVSRDYSRLTQILSMGIHSGLDPETCMDLAAGLISHPVVKARLEKASQLLKEGTLFSEALTQSELFEGMDARLVTVSDRAGSIDETLLKLSSRYHENTISLIGNAVSVVEPTIVIVFSLLVGLMLLSVMMPLLGILSEMIN